MMMLHERLKKCFNPASKCLIFTRQTVEIHSKDFNQSLTSVTFPSSLESLHLGKCFDQSINGAVIPNLETLTFGWSDSDALVVGCRFSYFSEIDYSYL